MRSRASVAVALAASCLLVAGCGGGDDKPESGATGPTTTGMPSMVTSTTNPHPRAAARWESLDTFSGNGPSTGLEVSLSPDMIQWRVQWTCETGKLRMETTPGPRRPGPLLDVACPGKGDAYSTVPDKVALKVDASGPWTAKVDQQIDTPLAEAPLPEMASAPIVAQGSFYNIEKTGTGTARLYQLPGNRRVLRFDEFTVSQNTDLFIWLSEAPSPKTSAEAIDAPKVVLGELRATIGSQNYEIPPEVPTDRIRSIVIWCEPVAIAYSGAALAA